ncbi:choice-of-anchor J domain-containing protein, partial [bacterium]|nr:choice-of-anchor J domain-containing protein [bacterium]
MNPKTKTLMWWIGSLFTLVALFPTQINAQVLQVPYAEDFETLSTCGTGCGSACLLTNGWTNDLSDDIDWTVDVGGTGSSNTGPGVDHNPGTSTGKYLYTETSGCNGDTTNLISPPIDLSAKVVEVSYWYHMFGATMGELHVDVSSDGGATWTLNVTPVVSGNQGNVWLNQTINLSAFLGDTVNVRFRGITGSSFTSDMAVDDVSFSELIPLDAGVTQILNPGGGVCAGTDSVVVEVQNFGTTTLTALSINWSINGAAQPPVTGI